MNFIEDAILPRSSDSLEKECNTAFKTSQGGSKTTFLPIKLQQSIIQAAMYASFGKQKISYWNFSNELKNLSPNISYNIQKGAFLVTI